MGEIHEAEADAEKRVLVVLFRLQAEEEEEEEAEETSSSWEDEDDKDADDTEEDVVEDIVVVHDCLALPLGSRRCRCRQRRLDSSEHSPSTTDTVAADRENHCSLVVDWHGYYYHCYWKKDLSVDSS